MPRHHERRALPYSRQQMYAIVADVERYPEFLPWCVGARIFKRLDGEFWADLVIGFRMFRERFTSRVRYNDPEWIEVDYVKGPLKHLHNRWRFEEAEDGHCVIDFEVDFEFRSALFEKLVGALFTEAVHRMVMAFESRARELYARPADEAFEDA
ncbi:MAG: type II toxin-antitoxin system RatA family toxin [Sphingomonadales bacterium]